MKTLLSLALIAFITIVATQRTCETDCFCPASIQNRCLDRGVAGSCITVGPGIVDGNIRMPRDSCLIVAADTVLNGNIISTASNFDRDSNDCVFINENARVNGRIDLRSGEDYLSLEMNSRVTGTIKLGADADCIVATSATVGQVDMGSENDHIFAAGLDVVNANLQPRDVILGSGNDCLEVVSNNKRSTSKKQITLSHIRDIFGGSGNDDIFLDTVDMRTMWGFNGDDCFLINDIRFYRLFGDAGVDQISATNWESTLVLTQSVNHIDGGKGVDRIDASNYNGINTPGRVDGGRNSASCCTDNTIEEGPRCGPCVPP